MGRCTPGGGGGEGGGKNNTANNYNHVLYKYYSGDTIFTPCICTRGKVIGSVVAVVIVNNTKLPDLDIWVS